MTKNQPRYYSSQFKQRALFLLDTGDYTAAELERQLGITKGLLTAWRREAEANDTTGSRATKPRTEAEAREHLRRLEREKARLEQEIEILKKLRDFNPDEDA